MNAPPKTRLILMAHGSRDPRWKASFVQIVAALERGLGPGAAALAFLEFEAPTLADSVRAAAEEGVTAVRVLPMFLASGKHVRADIPDIVRDLAAEMPGLDLELLPPLGDDPRVVDLMLEIARSAAPGLEDTSGASGETPGV